MTYNNLYDKNKTTSLAHCLYGIQNMFLHAKNKENLYEYSSHREVFSIH